MITLKPAIAPVGNKNIDLQKLQGTSALDDGEKYPNITLVPATPPKDWKGSGHTFETSTDANSDISVSKLQPAAPPQITSPIAKIPKTMSNVLNLIREKAKKIGVSESLAAGLIEHESGGRHTVNGKTLRNPNYPAFGITQLNENTAKRFGVKDIHDINQNLEGGLKNLQHWIDVYDGNVDKALAKYGGYGGDVKKAAKYITKVKRNAEKYKTVDNEWTGSVGKIDTTQVTKILREGKDVLKGYVKGVVEGATIPKFEEWGKISSMTPEQQGKELGKYVGITVPFGAALKTAKTMLTPITAFQKLTPVLQERWAITLGAALYKSAEGARYGKDPIETVKEIPQEIAAWLIPIVGFEKFSKATQTIAKSWTTTQMGKPKGEFNPATALAKVNAPTVGKEVSAPTQEMTFETAKSILTNKSQYSDNEIRSALAFLETKKSNLSKAVEKGAVSEVNGISLEQLQTMAAKGEDVAAPLRKALIDKTILPEQAEDLRGKILSGAMHLAKTTEEREAIFEHLKVQDINMRDVIESVKGAPTGEITELNMGLNPIKGLNTLDNLLGKGVSKLLDKTGTDKYIRIFANPDGFRYMPRSVINDFKQLYYGKLKGQIAKGELTSEELRNSLTPEMQKGLQDATVIRYLEEPKFRVEYDAAQPNNPIRAIAQELSDGSKELMKRGLILPSAHTKWGDRFLSRTYLAFGKEHGLGTGGIKGEKIERGRMIDSIMDVSPEKRASFGYVEDANQNIALSLYKQSKNIAVDDFTRGIISDPQLTTNTNFNYSVLLPKSLNITGKLPNIMSPYYAQSNILPVLKEAYQAGKISRNEIKRFIQQIKERKQALNELTKQPIPKGTTILGQDPRYGVLSGMPVNTDIGNLMRSLNVFNTPTELAPNLDKFMTALTGTFKWVKVPGNVPKALGRNAITNIGQWMASGANPVSFAIYVPRGIKHLVDKSKHWQTATENGLFKSNFVDEEVTKIFQQLHESTAKKGYKGFYAKWAEIMQSKPTMVMSNAYNAVDDAWKMSRYLYGIEKEGLSPVDAVIKAQEAHFDYSLTYNVIRAMRDADVQKSPAWKLLGSLFPTYSQKVLGLMYDSFRARPLRTVGLVGLPIAAATAINEEQRKKYGNAYTKLMRSIPTYLKDPATVGIYNKDTKKFEIINTSWLLPWGQWQGFATNVAQGEFKQGAKQLGVMSSPLYTPMAIWGNKNPFTDQEIYDPTQSLSKRALQTAGHLGETFLEPGIATFARKTLSSKKKTLKQNALQTAGIPYYEFSPKILKAIQAAKMKRIDMEINIRIGKLGRQLKAKDITQEKYNKEKKRLEHARKLMKQAD